MVWKWAVSQSTPVNTSCQAGRDDGCNQITAGICKPNLPKVAPLNPTDFSPRGLTLPGLFNMFYHQG